MLARYRVVVLIYVLVFALAAIVGKVFHATQAADWERFWAVGLIPGTVIAALWLLVCWVILPPSKSRLG